MDRVRRLADAVLYEGYLLWPYRATALKNQQRFTFGGVHPPAFDDRSCLQAQVLLEAGTDAAIDVAVRFLHVVRRQVLDATGAPVAELEAGGERWVSWDEAVEREIAVAPFAPGAPPASVAIAVPAGAEREPLPGGAALRRSWRALSGAIELASERAGAAWRLTCRVRNDAGWVAGARDDALRETLCSTHAVAHVDGGAWVSLTDPPPAHAAAAAACVNDGVWPVLVGEEGDRSTLLASPIILPDHPEIAPESPGDLFDSGEIDQMLVLNILAMTDDERRDMRDADPRARAILERTEALGEEDRMRLHGRFGELGPVRGR